MHTLLPCGLSIALHTAFCVVCLFTRGFDDDDNAITRSTVDGLETGLSNQSRHTHRERQTSMSIHGGFVHACTPKTCCCCYCW
uniref:Putative secreted protein n=1 Tax=Anopheles triannulatus TaxID=58253 RepID=A0A2M4B3T6_9DIPT